MQTYLFQIMSRWIWIIASNWACRRSDRLTIGIWVKTILRSGSHLQIQSLILNWIDKPLEQWQSELLMKWMTPFIVFYHLNKATMNGKIVIIKVLNLISKHWYAPTLTFLMKKTRCKSKLRWGRSSIGVIMLNFLKWKDLLIPPILRRRIDSSNSLMVMKKCKLIQR